MMDVSGFSVQMQQLQRNVDALMNRTPTTTQGYFPLIVSKTGLAILDTQGLIQVQSLLGSASFTASTLSTANSSTHVTITGASVTFTLARPLTVVAFGQISAKVTGVAGFAYVTVSVDTVAQAISAAIFDSGVPGYTSAATNSLQSLKAGSHTILLQVATDQVTTNLVTWGGGLLILLQGT